jgi:hypothetical protein
MPDNARSYTNQNVGLAALLSPDARAYTDENVSLAALLSKDARAYADENVGLELGLLVTQTTPLLTWGVPLSIPQTVQQIVPLTRAVEYGYEGEVTA